MYVYTHYVTFSLNMDKLAVLLPLLILQKFSKVSKNVSKVHLKYHIFQSIDSKYL